MHPLLFNRHLKLSGERLSSWLRGKQERRMGFHNWTGQKRGACMLTEDLGLSLSDTAKGVQLMKMATASSHLTAYPRDLEKVLPTKLTMTPGRGKKVSARPP